MSVKSHEESMENIEKMNVREITSKNENKGRRLCWNQTIFYENLEG